VDIARKFLSAALQVNHSLLLTDDNTTAMIQEEVILPMPCTEDELEEIEAWKKHVDEEADEMAKCEEYGGKVDLEIAAKVFQALIIPNSAVTKSEGLN
jgi:hypothetical protein